MYLARLALTISLSAAALSAHAQSFFAPDARELTDSSRFGLSAGISIFGYTLTPAYELNDRLSLRAPIGIPVTVPGSTAKWGGQANFDIFGFTVDTDIPLQVIEDTATPYADIAGYGLILDYYPKIDGVGDGLRLSAGLVKPQYKLYQEYNGAQTILANGRRFEATSSYASMEIPNVAPLVSMGYSFPIGDQGWQFALDAGVVFNVEYDGYNRATASNPNEQADLDAALAYELDKKLDELEPYPLLPWITFGLSYQF